MDQTETKETVEKDEVFGSLLLETIPLNSISITQLYMGSWNENKGEIHKAKKGFLKDSLGPFTIENQELDSSIDQLLRNKDAIFKGNGSIQEKLAKFYADNKPLFESVSIAINSIHYTLIPKLILRLSKELGFEDQYLPSVPLYQQLEEKIIFNFNIFSAEELSLINFALLTFQKKGSLHLRKQIAQRFQ